MRIKKNQHPKKTVRFALLFFAFIFLVVVGSFIIKGVGVVQASLFDGQHRFTILLKSEKEPQNVLLSFSPNDMTASVLRIYEKQVLSPQELGVFFGIPIDAVVSFGNNYSLQENDISTLFQYIVFRQDNVKTNMTFLDAVRLWMFVDKIPAHKFYEKKYIFSSNSINDQDAGELDTLVLSLFADSAVIEEKKSVHIINSSGVSGLGNRIARIVTNMGGNVVAVSTGDSVLPVSEIIYSDQKSYTLEKLQRIFRSKAVNTQKQVISDIVVIVGKDKSPLFTIKQ